MTSYILGFWGNYRIHKQMLRYLDTVLYRRLQLHGKLSVWVALTSDCNLFIANRIIALRRIYPDLRLCVVITAKQHGIYLSGRTASACDKQRNKAIAASARSAVVPDSTAYVRAVHSNRIFLHRCDEIICCDTLIDPRAKHDFDSQYRLLAERRPIITDMMSEYPIGNPHDFTCALDFSKAVELLHRCDFELVSFPPQVSAKWSASAPEGCEELLARPAEEVYALEDDGRNEYLSLKVFLYIYNHSRGTDAPITAGKELEAAMTEYSRFGQWLENVARENRKKDDKAGTI